MHNGRNFIKIFQSVKQQKRCLKRHLLKHKSNSPKLLQFLFNKLFVLFRLFIILFHYQLFRMSSWILFSKIKSTCSGTALLFYFYFYCFCHYFTLINSRLNTKNFTRTIQLLYLMSTRILAEVLFYQVDGNLNIFCRIGAVGRNAAVVYAGAYLRRQAVFFKRFSRRCIKMSAG